MKGDVLHYDDNVGTGQISGADGIRYSFTRADLKQLVPIGRGTKVDFDFEGKVAKDIYIDGPGSVPHAPASPAPAYATPAAPAATGPEPNLGLWAYFIRAYTSRYAQFNGRARRKEYWSVALFAGIFSLICYAMIFAGILGRPLDGTDLESIIEAMMRSPISTIGVAILLLFALVSILPVASLLFRRVHDLGLTGWIAALILLCSVLGYFVSILSIVAGIGYLVVAFMPGKAGDNKYGPSPK